MRRKGSAIYAPGKTRSLSDRGVPVDRVVAALSGLVLEERLARMMGVFSERVESVTVLMDSPHDPHNGSAVVRTLDAFGVQDLHVVERDFGARKLRNHRGTGATRATQNLGVGCHQLSA